MFCYIQIIELLWVYLGLRVLLLKTVMLTVDDMAKVGYGSFDFLLE